MANLSLKHLQYYLPSIYPYSGFQHLPVLGVWGGGEGGGGNEHLCKFCLNLDRLKTQVNFAIRTFIIQG